MAMVEEGEESGAIQANEKEFIENVFEFDNMTARDVMIHRTDMVTLSLDEDTPLIPFSAEKGNGRDVLLALVEAHREGMQ